MAAKKIDWGKLHDQVLRDLSLAIPVRAIARSIGVDESTIRHRFKKEIEEAEVYRERFGRTSLYNLVKQGSWPATHYYLRNVLKIPEMKGDEIDGSREIVVNVLANGDKPRTTPTASARTTSKSK